MNAVPIQFAQPASVKILWQLPPDQMPNPDPRQRPKRDFQSARPIDSPMIWVRGKPALKLRLNLIQVRLIASEEIGLRQDHQVLVPAQLPNHFVVPGLGCVQVRNQTKVIEAGFNPAYVVAPPTDLRSSLDSQPQNWKTMRSNFLRE